MAEIKLESVAKTFGAFSAVKDVSFAIDHGSFFVILDNADQVAEAVSGGGRCKLHPSPLSSADQHHL